MKRAILLSFLVAGSFDSANESRATSALLEAPMAAVTPSAPPTTLAEGIVTVGTDAPGLLDSIRDAIVNEKIMQRTQKPYHLTSGEKANPGGGVLNLCTEPNDGGIVFSIKAYRGDLELGVPASLDLVVTVPKKQGVSDNEMMRRIYELNPKTRLKVYILGDSVVIQGCVYLPELASWGFFDRTIGTHLLGALVFAVENAKSESPICAFSAD